MLLFGVAIDGAASGGKGGMGIEVLATEAEEAIAAGLGLEVGLEIGLKIFIGGFPPGLQAGRIATIAAAVAIVIPVVTTLPILS
jgi:hypothetical protein